MKFDSEQYLYYTAKENNLMGMNDLTVMNNMADILKGYQIKPGSLKYIKDSSKKDYDLTGKYLESESFDYSNGNLNFNKLRFYYNGKMELYGNYKYNPMKAYISDLEYEKVNPIFKFTLIDEENGIFLFESQKLFTSLPYIIYYDVDSLDSLKRDNKLTYDKLLEFGKEDFEKLGYNPDDCIFDDISHLGANNNYEYLTKLIDILSKGKFIDYFKEIDRNSEANVKLNEDMGRKKL